MQVMCLGVCLSPTQLTPPPVSLVDCLPSIALPLQPSATCTLCPSLCTLSTPQGTERVTVANKTLPALWTPTLCPRWSRPSSFGGGYQPPCCLCPAARRYASKRFGMVLSTEAAYLLALPPLPANLASIEHMPFALYTSRCLLGLMSPNVPVLQQPPMLALALRCSAVLGASRHGIAAVGTSGRIRITQGLISLGHAPGATTRRSTLCFQASYHLDRTGSIAPGWASSFLFLETAIALCLLASSAVFFAWHGLQIAARLLSSSLPSSHVGITWSTCLHPSAPQT